MKSQGLVAALLAFAFAAFSADAGLPEVWTLRSSPTSARLSGVTYGGGQFIAVGAQGTILGSPDGVSWVPRSGVTSTGQLFSVAYGGGWFVAVGEENARIESSTDGINWTNRLGAIGGEDVRGITYANGIFVAVGRRAWLGLSYVITSSDTIGWRNHSELPTTNFLFAVTHGNGQFVAVGEDGAIITSPNGTNWTLRNSGTQVPLRSVVFHNSRFIAGGDGNTVLTSSDGINWSPGAPPSFAVRGLASDGAAVVAVGSPGSIGKIHASTDGLSWPGSAEDFSQPLNGIAHGPGSFVAVGDGGLIIQSELEGINEWTKPTSGYWEEAYWSLGELPSIEHDTIAFRNPGFKALAIGSTTTANHANSLSINNLMISEPGNLLLLNYAGPQTPLRVAGDFALDSNAALLSYYSGLIASNFYISGRATFAEQSVANFGLVRVGMLTPGELTISNAVISSETLFVGDPSGTGVAGRVSQHGGTNQVIGGNDLRVTYNSAYFLSGGTLLAPSMNFVGGGVPSQFTISGGRVKVQGSIGLLRSGFLFEAGELEAAAMYNREGRATQNGGINAVGELGVAYATQHRNAEYLLAAGVLLSSNVIVGNGFGVFGTFNQSGGFHTNTGQITMWGFERTQQNHVQGEYNLNGGFLTARKISAYGGVFHQSGGTNRVEEIALDFNGGFALTGGTLESSNTIFVGSVGSLPYYSPNVFVHSNGIHTVRNELIINKTTSPSFQRGGIYYLRGGTLNSHFVDIADGFEQSGGTHTNDYIIQVHGRYNLSDGLLVTRFLYPDGRGQFIQTGGTNLADRMYVDVWSAFHLRGGTLSTSNSTISGGSPDFPYRASFFQSNGTHVIRNWLTVDGIYELHGGALTASNIVIYPDSDLRLRGGTVSNPGRFTMYDGVCIAQGRYENLGKLFVRVGILSRYTNAHISTLDLQNGSTVLRFQDSRDVSSEWNSRLVILNWSGGADHIFVGTSAQGLTAAQLERIMFMNPEGAPAGNYPAQILANGELMPANQPAVNFRRSSNQGVISWQGNYQLLTATNAGGPYELIMDASSPYTNFFTDRQRYFQLRSRP